MLVALLAHPPQSGFIHPVRTVGPHTLGTKAILAVLVKREEIDTQEDGTHLGVVVDIAPHPRFGTLPVQLHPVVLVPVAVFVQVNDVGDRDVRTLDFEARLGHLAGNPERIAVDTQLQPLRTAVIGPVGVVVLPVDRRPRDITVFVADTQVVFGHPAVGRDQRIAVILQVGGHPVDVGLPLVLGHITVLLVVVLIRTPVHRSLVALLGIDGRVETTIHIGAVGDAVKFPVDRGVHRQFHFQPHGGRFADVAFVDDDPVQFLLRQHTGTLAPGEALRPASGISQCFVVDADFERIAGRSVVGTAAPSDLQRLTRGVLLRKLHGIGRHREVEIRKGTGIRPRIVAFTRRNAQRPHEAYCI